MLFVLQHFFRDSTHLYFAGPHFAKAKNYGFHGEFDEVHTDWSDWQGILWETYAINKSKASLRPKVISINHFRKSIAQLKFIVRRKLLGHGGETHFLWVLQKPRKRLG